MAKNMTLDVLIADDIRYQIDSNIYSSGERLPSEIDLCTKYNVQKMTIRSALQILKNEGRIYSIDKIGNFVSDKRVEINLRKFKSTTNIIKNMGRKNDVKVISLEEIVANKNIAMNMDVNIGEDIYHLVRLRKIDGNPVSIDVSYLNKMLFNNLKNYDLNNNSLYGLLEKEFNCKIDRACMRIVLINADDYTSKLLNVEVNTPLVKELGFVYNDKNIKFEYMERTMLIDKFVFVN